MQTILDEIRSGAFADEWIAENKAGAPASRRCARRARRTRSRPWARAPGDDALHLGRQDACAGPLGGLTHTRVPAPKWIDLTSS